MKKNLKTFKTVLQNQPCINNKKIFVMNCGDIEALTEDQAKEIALFKKVIKNYNVYFIDFGGYFKFSAIVYKSNKQIKYANIYGLHYRGKWDDVTKTTKPYTITELYKKYIKALNNKLFTEDELLNKDLIKTYDDIKARFTYLHNYYNLEYDYISAFNIITAEKDRIEYEQKISGMIYNPIGFCYMKKDYKHIIEKQKDIYIKLLDIEEEMKKNYNYLYEAFKYEMFNHEYAINSYQRNYDTLSAIYGDIEYDQNDDRVAYYKQLKFNDTQIQAYEDARKHVLKHSYY